MIRYDEDGNPIYDEEIPPAQTEDAPSGGTGGGGSGGGSAAGDFDPSKVPADVPVDWARDFIRRNPGDYHRLASAYGSGRTGGASAGGGSSDWFNRNAPSLSSFGAPPDPFGESYTPEVYTPPTWNESFTAPSYEALLTDPGYLAGESAMQRGLERSAASKGSVLSGGFAGRALPRALGEYAGGAYKDLFSRAFDTYQQRYGQFNDAASRGFNAFTANEGNRQAAFNTRYRNYQDTVQNRLTSERDRWNREMDLARLGLDSTTAGRPSS